MLISAGKLYVESESQTLGAWEQFFNRSKIVLSGNMIR